MNNARIDIKRIEFAVTHACTGKCKHCSIGMPDEKSRSIDPAAAVKAVKELTSRYAVESLMTFGGEPLLYTDTVCRIHQTARDCGIPLRQIITNGFFTRDERRIKDVAAAISDSGVNHVMISVDAFHQEYIPIEPVMLLVESLAKNGISKLRVHPAWLVNEPHRNPYNEETRRLLKIFNDMGIESSKGNNISPSGNAVKYLSEYFPPPGALDLSIPCGQLPYTGRLDEIECVSFNPNGDLIICRFPIGNIYEDDVLTILGGYNPYDNPAMRALLEGGVQALVDYAQGLGVTIDTSDCYSACKVCRKTMAALKARQMA